MRTLMATFLAAGLTCGPGALLAQKQSPSTNGSAQNSQDVPHQEPGTDSPDLGKQRTPTPKQSPGENNPAKKSPTENTPDVPHQEPGTDSPDLGKQRQPGPGDTGSTEGTQSRSNKNKSRNKNKKQTSTASQSQTSTQS